MRTDRFKNIKYPTKQVSDAMTVRDSDKLKFHYHVAATFYTCLSSAILSYPLREALNAK